MDYLKNRNTFFLPLITISFLLLQSCLSDLRTPLVKEQQISADSEQKGRELISKAWKNQGMDKLRDHKTYQMEGTDDWRGFLGNFGPWPQKNTGIQFKYSINSFDGNITFLSGKRKGLTAGLQSWKYYEKEPGKSLEFMEKGNDKIIFGLTAFQYFTEILDRLKGAPIVSYAGEELFHGEMYDLVFVTWETVKPNKRHDQYMLYINQKTGILDYAGFTIRDNYLPMSQPVKSMIEFTDFREVKGIKIPFRQVIYVFYPNKKKSDILHELVLESFSFDSFEVSELYPDQNLEYVGNSKPASK